MAIDPWDLIRAHYDQLLQLSSPGLGHPLDPVGHPENPQRKDKNRLAHGRMAKNPPEFFMILIS